MNLQDYKWAIGSFVLLWAIFVIPEVLMLDINKGWYGLPYILTSFITLCTLGFMTFIEARDRYIERNS